MKHLALIPFSVTIVFLNELDLCLRSHHVYVVHLLFKHLFSEGLFLSHLREILQLLQVLDHVAMPDILSGKHAQHILEVVVLEHIIGWHLQIRDEFAHVFRVSFDHLSYHLCFIFEIRYELFKILYFYVPSGHRIVALPNKLELSNHVFEYFDAFLLIRVGESVQNDCHEQIEEDYTDN